MCRQLNINIIFENNNSFLLKKENNLEDFFFLDKFHEEKKIDYENKACEFFY